MLLSKRLDDRRRVSLRDVSAGEVSAIEDVDLHACAVVFGPVSGAMCCGRRSEDTLGPAEEEHDEDAADNEEVEPVRRVSG